MVSERPGHPHASSAVARYVSRRIDELRGYKTMREIAAEAGYSRPNILSMLKMGETALPLARVPALAQALEADPAHVFRLAMSDQWPGLHDVVEEVFGRQLATANEAELFLHRWRAISADLDPKPTPDMTAAIDAILPKLLAATRA